MYSIDYFCSMYLLLCTGVVDTHHVMKTVSHDLIPLFCSFFSTHQMHVVYYIHCIIHTIHTYMKLHMYALFRGRRPRHLNTFLKQRLSVSRPSTFDVFHHSTVPFLHQTQKDVGRRRTQRRLNQRMVCVFFFSPSLLFLFSLCGIRFPYALYFCFSEQFSLLGHRVHIC